MSKRGKRILFAGVLLALGLCVAWFSRGEPKYRGRTLAQWFLAARADGADATVLIEFNTAVRVIGTNDLPGLVRHISFDENCCLPQRIINILPGSVTPRRLLKYLLDQKWSQHAEANDAGEVFRVLGADGAPAIPELAKIAIYGPPAPAYRAVDCLGQIGEPAIPALIMVATNPQPRSIRAYGWLAGHTNSPAAMRIVAQCSCNPNFMVLVRAHTAEFLRNTP
jgi:hypothetical protein